MSQEFVRVQLGWLFCSIWCQLKWNLKIQDSLIYISESCCWLSAKTPWFFFMWHLFLYGLLLFRVSLCMCPLTSAGWLEHFYLAVEFWEQKWKLQGHLRPGFRSSRMLLLLHYMSQKSSLLRGGKMASISWWEEWQSFIAKGCGCKETSFTVCGSGVRRSTMNIPWHAQRLWKSWNKRKLKEGHCGWWWMKRSFKRDKVGGKGRTRSCGIWRLLLWVWFYSKCSKKPLKDFKQRKSDTVLLCRAWLFAKGE